jgi:hypothetical protein
VPTCEYSLHLGSIHGPIATNAQLGNKVFHEWKCNTENFAIKIYECYVHDGGNRRYLIIDEHGYSVSWDEHGGRGEVQIHMLIQVLDAP